MEVRSGPDPEKEKILRLLWAKSGYRPSVGDFPIYEPDGTLRIVSRGQSEIHDCGNRLVLVTGGVRGGKSQFVAMEMLRDIFVQDGLIWIVGPDYEQCKAEFNYMYEPLHSMGFIADDSVPDKGTRHFTTKWGCKVQTKSADDLKTLASFAPHALAGVEMGQQTYTSYEKLLERALEHNARVLMSGTLEGALSWYGDLWERWQAPNPEGGRSFSLPSWSNLAKFPGGRDNQNIRDLENALTPELFLERVAAVPFKPSGLVHKLFDPRLHVKKLEFDPNLPIELAIDPARHTYAVLAVQWAPVPGVFTQNTRGERVPLTEVRVVDQVYEHDTDAYEIIEIAQDRRWFSYVRGGVIDIAGTQRNANKSQVQIWGEETGIRLRSRPVSIPDGIDVVNLRLRVNKEANQPLLFFSHYMRSDKDHAGRANGVLAEFGLYRWPDWREGQSSSNRPIDANNDGCKALGYWLYDRFGPVTERSVRRKSTVRSYYGVG